MYGRSNPLGPLMFLRGILISITQFRNRSHGTAAGENFFLISFSCDMLHNVSQNIYQPRVGCPRNQLRSLTGRALAAVLLLSLMLLSESVWVPPSHAVEASGFTVVSAVWGSSAAAVQPAPAAQNVPLILTLQNHHDNTAQGISVSLDLPSGFTDTNGNSVSTAYVSGQVRRARYYHSCTA